MRTLVFIALLFLAAQARAGDSAKVRVGSHAGYDRLVFEFSEPTPFTVDRQSDVVTVHFGNAGLIPNSSIQTRFIKGVTGGDAIATISVQPGAQIQATQLDRRVVLDVKQASLRKTSLPGLASISASAVPQVSHAKGSARLGPPAAAAAAKSNISVTSELAGQPDGAAPASNVSVAEPAPVGPVVAVAPASSGSNLAASSISMSNPPSSEPISVSAKPVDTASDPASSAVLLPFGREVGAAAFRRGAEAWVVFDEPRPIDAASFQDQAAFAKVKVEVLPAATLLRFPLGEDNGITLRRVDQGWILTAGPFAVSQLPLLPAVRGERLLFPVAATGKVVVVIDAATGQNLDVATLRAAGPGVPVSYCTPDFNVLPSWQGVVAEPLSDRTIMRDVVEGVAIETGAPFSPAPDSARALADAAVLTRRFDFPPLSAASLLRRLQAQVADEAAAPPRDRLLPRKAVAQTLLALGLGPEAQSLLRLAADEDPRTANDPDFQGLSGIAAVLSGRPTEANGLLDPGLNGSDEVSLWRAARAASRQEGSPEAAALFAATTKLILSYPKALRDRLLPLAVETMASGGAAQAADALLAKLPDDPGLALARAMRLEAKGDSGGALALYNALATGRDRLVSARAAARAVRLRLATHAIGPAEAADDLEAGFLDWRGDNRERDLRLEVVDLRAQAGQWRRAFGLLKETAALYPDDAPKFRDQTTKLLTTLLHGDGAATISPLDLVALAEENAEEAAKAAPDEITALLADKLVALDLPKQAAPVIERMLAAAPAGSGRATLGARLASIRLAAGDPEGGEAALADSDAPNLPPTLMEQRGLIAARIRAQRHDVPGAAAILAGLDSSSADDLRATILSDAGDWRGAEAALTSLAGRLVPSTGPLTSDQQDVLLRLASAQTRAGDDDASRALGVQEASRMSGPRSEMFRLLTAAPIAGVKDLGRSAGELAMARAIPAGLAAIGKR